MDSPGEPGLSAKTISRFKEQWVQDYEQWRKRDLSKKRYLYVWADGVYCNVSFEDARLCLPYTLLGQIEEWRLEYGRPSSEPRHPAYESGKPWPPLPPDSGEADRHQQQ